MFRGHLVSVQRSVPTRVSPDFRVARVPAPSVNAAPHSMRLGIPATPWRPASATRCCHNSGDRSNNTQVPRRGFRGRRRNRSAPGGLGHSAFPARARIVEPLASRTQTAVQLHTLSCAFDSKYPHICSTEIPPSLAVIPKQYVTVELTHYTVAFQPGTQPLCQLANVLEEWSSPFWRFDPSVHPDCIMTHHPI